MAHQLRQQIDLGHSHPTDWRKNRASLRGDHYCRGGYIRVENTIGWHKAMRDVVRDCLQEEWDAGGWDERMG
jgi:hypothetical protein